MMDQTVAVTHIDQIVNPDISKILLLLNLCQMVNLAVGKASGQIEPECENAGDPAFYRVIHIKHQRQVADFTPEQG